MRKLLNKRAQSTLEYAVLIAIVVVGLTGIRIYMKRGVEGKLRSTSDNIGAQFDPHKTEYTYNADTTSKTVEYTGWGVVDSRMDTGPYGSVPEVTKEYGTETVGKWTPDDPNDSTDPFGSD